MKLSTRIFSLALGLSIAALASTPAFAVTVVYSTIGSFSPSQAPTVSFAGYTGGAAVYPDLPATVQLGTFNVANTGYYRAGWVPFTLTIDETSPTNGSNNFDAHLTGIITSSGGYYGGGLNLLFRQTAVTIGSETYELMGTTSQGHLHGFSIANNGPTTLNAQLFTSVADAPEPTFYALTGTAFAGLLAMAIRQRRQSAV